MKSKLWQNALGAMGIALATPVMAFSIDFETVPTNFYTTGESFTQASVNLAVQSGVGVVDTAAAFGPGSGLDLAVPLGTLGKFYSGLNDGVLTLTSIDSSPFKLFSLDFSFISPLTNLYALGDVPGMLLMAYTVAGGDGSLSWNFGAADVNGKFTMTTLADPALTVPSYLSVSFSACTFNGFGGCVAPNGNFNQFALDNISAVPEPTPVVLALTALVFGLGRRLLARRAR